MPFCVSGSAPYTPVSVNSAGSHQGTNNNATNSSTTAEAGSDFPDFTFDTSDLLGGGDVTQPGVSVSVALIFGPWLRFLAIIQPVLQLFNDPEELMKYLADDTDFGGGFAFNNSNSNGAGNSLSSSSIDDKQQRNSQTTSALFDSSTKRHSTSSASTGGQQQHNDGPSSSADLASMDDILSFLDK